MIPIEKHPNITALFKISTPLEKHRFIEKVLWALKFPEVLSTLVFFIGIGPAVLGWIPTIVPLLAFCTRVGLIVVRVIIVKIKRKLEKDHGISKITYIPEIVKKGTRKVEFVTKYK